MPVPAASLVFSLAVLAFAGAGGCRRMIIGRLAADVDAAADATVDGSVEEPQDARDATAGLVDVQAGDNAPAGDGATVPDGATAMDGPAARDAEAGSDAGDGRADSPSGDGGDADADADAARDAVAETGPPPIGVLAGRITMSDLTNFTSRGSGVAGVRVMLTGPSARSAISDANGGFQFPSIAPGTYTVSVTKDGATLTPPSATGVAVAAASGGTVVNFDCAPPCGTGPIIDPARELFIEDTSVLTDARSLQRRRWRLELSLPHRADGDHVAQ